MTVDFVDLDVDEVKSMFYLEDGELYRSSSNSRFDGMYVDDQKMVRIGDVRPTVNRVKYILLNDKLPKGEVLMNDRGELVDIEDNHLRMIVALRDSANIREYKNGKYFARYVDRNGVRIGKSFDTYKEARDHARDMTAMIWSDVANKYGFDIAV